MTVEETSSITTSGRLVRWFVAGLPLGLIVMGALSFVIYFQKRKEKPPTVLEFASLLQRDVNEEDFQRYIKVLADDIGGSTMSSEEKLEACATFIESSMGMENMGYEVLRKKYDTDGGIMLEGLFAELPGSKGSGSVVVVATRYDLDFNDKNVSRQQAACVSAMLSVAHAITGLSPAQTIRFVALKGDSIGEFAKDAQSVFWLVPDGGKNLKDNEAKLYFIDASKGREMNTLQTLQSTLESAAGIAAR